MGGLVGYDSYHFLKFGFFFPQNYYLELGHFLLLSKRSKHSVTTYYSSINYPNQHPSTFSLMEQHKETPPPPQGGVGRILFLSQLHTFKLSIGIGSTKNNFAELLALKLLLHITHK